MNSIPFKNQILFVLYFGASTVLTWAFVALSPLYISREQQLISTAVAGGKWGLQILMAFIFLRQQSWTFVKNIGFVCFLGSCILLPYIIFSVIGISNGVEFFIGSLLASVLAMIYYYYKATRLSFVAIKWWYAWLTSLAIAIFLQLTWVFDIL